MADQNVDDIPQNTDNDAAVIDTPPASTMKMPSTSEIKGDKQSIGDILNKDIIKGMDLNASLDGLTGNMVAIACLHNQSTSSSNVLNNMEKSLKSFTAVKLTNVPGGEIDSLNKSPDTTTAKCEVLDSKNNKNITEISEPDAKNKNAQLFALIKTAISSDTDISTGIVGDSKRTEIATYNTVLGQLSGVTGALDGLKFAAFKNSCTQVVFGVEYDDKNEVKRVVGRAQSVGAGPTGAVQTGDFSMDLDGDKFVITAGKDQGITIKTILKKILNTKKSIEVKVEKPEKPATATASAIPAAGNSTNSFDADNATPTEGGGKSKRRRHKKKGTRKHKPKRTMKKRKSSRRRSSKK